MMDDFQGKEKHTRRMEIHSQTVPDDHSLPTVYIIRHGQSLHNVERGYPHRDPPLTEKGEEDARHIRLSNETEGILPDLILISPMTRAIQTAILAFPTIFQCHPFKCDVRIWPDLREAHDANCNRGISRSDLTQKFPGFDFSTCRAEWDYPPHTIEDATVRAETVRKQLKTISMSGHYRNIAVISHRGFIAFLIRGDRFNVCEARSYRFAAAEEVEDETLRIGINVDTGRRQDFGPTLLMPKVWNEEKT